MSAYLSFAGHPFFGWYAFPWFPLIPLAWLLIVFLIVFFVARYRRRHWQGAGNCGESAQELLAKRFARGEINEQEYRDRLQVLKDHK